MEISFCSHPNTNKVIATIFGTWHDSWAVVACAKFCCDMVISNWKRAKWNFHRIWIVMEKSLVKWVPDCHRTKVWYHNGNRPVLICTQNHMYHNYTCSKYAADSVLVIFNGCMIRYMLNDNQYCTMHCSSWGICSLFNLLSVLYFNRMPSGEFMYPF